MTYESIRQWCLKFGKTYAKKLRNQYGKKSDCWFLNEVYIKIRGDNSDLTDLYICVSMISVKSSVLERFTKL